MCLHELGSQTPELHIWAGLRNQVTGMSRCKVNRSSFLRSDLPLLLQPVVPPPPHLQSAAARGTFETAAQCHRLPL